MKKIVFACAVGFFAVCVSLKTWSQKVSHYETLSVLYDFEDKQLPNAVELKNSTSEFVKANSIALKVQFNSENSDYSTLSFTPKKPWDWSQFDDFHIAFDIANEGKHSVQLNLNVVDINGSSNTRSINIPVGNAKTYYAKLAGHDLALAADNISIDHNFHSGLRSNPDTWQSNDIKFISFWGKKNLNLKGIKSIRLGVSSTLFDKTITIDNIRLRKNPAIDQTFLTNIIDRFGQSAKQDYPGKIHSEKSLILAKKQEAKTFTGKYGQDRSQFGGWLSGPKLKATGYFRTEKVDGKWTLVDPKGHIYFATGVDIIRISGGNTMTGYDYKNRKDKSTRYPAFTKRTEMFQWLPKFDDPLAKHYGYAGRTHSGALKKGESYNFHRANLERKYGENYEQAWENVTINRMLTWGFTSLGNWTTPSLYQNNKVPFFANGWIKGKFKTVSSGNDFWGAMPDVFDPAFQLAAEVTAKRVASEVNNNPWCVGVFIDNEKSFGRSGSKKNEYGIVIDTLKRDGNKVPTKAHFTKMMKAKYGTIAKLNSAWNKNISNWQAFQKGFDASLNKNKTLLNDYGDMLFAYGKQYFSTVQTAMKQQLPNHLYLGSRFAAWGMPIEIVRASAQHTDVISFNMYKEGLKPDKWQFLKEIDKPAIIGEFHIGAMDRGMYHPGIVIAANQQDRAKMYKDYLNSVLAHPNLVGAHYFQYFDGPIAGRAYDGENYNIGFVSATDTPYVEMVEAAKEINRDMYHKRYNF